MKRKIDGNKLSIQNADGSSILTIEVSVAEDKIMIMVSGSMTHDAAPEFEDELMAVLTSKRNTVFGVDFSELDHISAPGLKALLQAQKFVDEKGYKFYVQNLTESVKKIFTDTGFIDLINITDTKKADGGSV